jgi:hypothetical protein
MLPMEIYSVGIKPKTAGIEEFEAFMDKSAKGFTVNYDGQTRYISLRGQSKKVQN